MKRLALAVALVFAACGGDDDGGSATATTTADSSVTSSTVAGATTTSSAASPFGTTRVSTPDTAQQVVLAKLDVGLHSGFERVVFRFRENDATIGYAVNLADPPFTQDGSGNTVNVSGSSHIAVRIVGAAHDEEGKVSYPDGERVRGQDAITEVVRTGDFEGIVSFVIGTNGDRPFRVFTLTNPTRLVVDVQGP